MKKHIVKCLSAFMALVLLLSVLPVGARAAETVEHEHADICGCDDSNIMPAALTCKDGQHVYYHNGTSQYTNCGGVHRVDVRTVYVCGVCGYSYTGGITNSYYEAHSYSKTAVGTDPDSGKTIYYYACRCGNSYYDT